MQKSIEHETYYKFCAIGGRSPYGRIQWNLPGDEKANLGSPGPPGEWMPKLKGNLMECSHGYHACRERDLIHWIRRELYVVEFREKPLEYENKVVGREARIVRRVENWNVATMRLFAADCAERVLHLFEEERSGDRRPRAAIDAAREYVHDDTSAVPALYAAEAAAYAVFDLSLIHISEPTRPY